MNPLLTHCPKSHNNRELTRVGIVPYEMAAEFTIHV
jgi:hypothetical protein